MAEALPDSEIEWAIGIYHSALEAIKDPASDEVQVITNRAIALAIRSMLAESGITVAGGIGNA